MPHGVDCPEDASEPTAGDRTVQVRHLDTLFREHGGRVRAYARSLVPCPHEADDVTSEVFLLMVRRSNDLPDAPSAVAAWLLRATRLVVANVRRKATRRRRILGEQAPFVTAPGVEEVCVLRSSLGEALKHLGDQDRDLLIDATVHGRPHDELAAEAGVALSTISSRISRSRAAMKAELRK